jgi:GNAT superfamily N-acetyltransferase
MGPGMHVNRAIGVGVAEPARPADVDFIVDFYASHASDAEIELCPYAHDAVRSRTTELGFGLDWFRTVYARTIGPGSLRSPSGSFVFTRVDSANFMTWADLWIEQSDDADGERRFTRARNAKPGEHDFVVSLDGAPVAVCSLSIHDGLADLGGMLTCTEYRNRGIQAACLDHRLAYAAESGCDPTTAGATPGTSSARNIERAGFEALYTSAALRRSLRP